MLVRRDRFPTTMSAPHRHRTVEFNLVLSGAATYLLDDRRYDLQARSLVWLFPGQNHIMVQRTSEYRDWLGLIPQDTLQEWCSTPATAPLLEADPPGLFVRRVPATAASALDALMCQVVTSSDDAAPAGRVYAVLAAWDAFCDADPVEETDPVHPAVREAMQVLCAPDPPHDLPALSERVGLSPQHLSRVFLRETGIGIAQFRNEQRLRTFVELYDAAPDRPMLDLALQAGFGSAAQFHRVFKELTGTTPAAHLSRRGSA